MRENKFEIKENGGFAYTTARATYLAHRRSKRFNHTMLMCNVAITNSKHQSKNARVNVDLFDDTSIKSKCEVLADTLELNAETLMTDMKLLAIDIEALLNAPEEQKSIPIDEASAKKLLKKEGLFNVIQQVLGMKIAGEKKTSLLLFLIAISYKSQKTLHSILSANSSAGKSYILESVTSVLPPEDLLTYTVMTRSSIPNLQANELKGKCLLIEDVTGIDKQAEFHLREIQSKGKIAISKFSQEHGHTIRKEIEAHCSTLTATTKDRVYRDNENRSFMLKLDESKKQTERVLKFKSKVKGGELDTDAITKAVGEIRNAVRFLKPLEVVNPFASKIIIPEACKDRRRLQDLFLGLIDVITFLHQLQREKDEEGRLITTIEDIELALELTMDMFLLKSDELSNSNRLFLEELKPILQVKSDEEITSITFKVDELLGKVQGGNSSIYRKIKALQKEGVLVQVGGNQRVGNRYRLLFDDEFLAKRELIKSQLLNGIESIKNK